MKKKKIIIFTVIAFVILMGVFVGIYVANKSKKDNKDYSQTAESQTENNTDKEKTIDNLTKVEQKIADIDTSNSKNKEINEKNYSELYKEYLKLPEEEKEKSEVIPRKEEVPFEKLEEIKENLDQQDKKDDNNKNENNKEENQIKENDKEIIPDKFNLADKIDIKVKNQANYGLCWDFASIKTLETYLALNKLGNFDFSEAHVDYITSNLLYGSRKVHEAGAFETFKNYLIESGVVLEDTVPYGYTWTNTFDGKEYKYFDPYEYKEDEYNKFPEMEKVVEVTETVDFPSFYKSKDNESKYTDDQIAEFRKTVKRHIMKNGGLYTSIVGTGAKNYYVSVDTPEWANHAVTIVGWDDNYSKDNFLSSDGKKPSKDGAYIAVNSWGENFNDKGYYYISYEDKYVESNLSGITSTSMDSAYKISSIKNPAIKKYLINNYRHVFINYNGEEYITKNALANINILDLSNSNISSLEGIEIFTNLYDINLSNNNIDDITPLTKISTLTTINLSNNNIKDVSAFKNMKTKSLYLLNLSNNKINDVSALNDIINKNEYNLLDLDISNNPNIKGYEKLSNLGYLNISNCNIKDVSNLKNCEKLQNLQIENTKGIKGLEQLPENLNSLDISNCGVNTLPEVNKNIQYLYLKKNNLTTLNGIEKYENLCSIDISENPITDWSALKNIKKENIEQKVKENQDISTEQTSETEEKMVEYEEYQGEEDYGIDITANNCNIDDITIFNNVNVSSLILKDNKIKDVSKFQNDNIYCIDLSNNRNLTGLQGLSKVSTLFLDNCDITDISEILKFENLLSISLENNNITDITGFSKMKNMENLSLAGNKKLSGILTNENIQILNVSDCNLNNNFDFSGVPNIYCLNISKNPNIKNISEISKNFKNGYINLILDEIDLDELEKIKSESNDKYFYMSNMTINLDYNLPNNENKIDLSKYTFLKKELMQNLINGSISIENGHLTKKGYIIDIDDVSKGNIKIKFKELSFSFPNSIIKIAFDSNKIKSNDKSKNSTRNNIANTIESNTENENNNKTNVIDNNTTNIIDESNSTISNITNNNTNTENTLNENTNTNNKTNTNALNDNTNTNTNSNTNNLNNTNNTNTNNNINTNTLNNNTNENNSLNTNIQNSFNNTVN